MKVFVVVGGEAYSPQECTRLVKCIKKESPNTKIYLVSKDNYAFEIAASLDIDLVQDLNTLK